MEKQKLNSKLKVKTDNVLQYLQVFNGIFNLTDKELEILALFVEFGDKNDLCNIDSKKSVAKTMNIEDPNTLNSYVKRLKDKKAITQSNNKYKLSDILTIVPVKSIEIVKNF